MITNLIGWILFGLIAGAIARLLTPGRDPIGCFGTIALGVVGSFTGGFLLNLLFGDWEDRFSPAGLIGSVLGGILVLIIARRLANRR